MLEFLEATLYASQSSEPGRLETVTDTVLQYLESNDFIERESGGSDDSEGVDDGAFTSAATLADDGAATRNSRRPASDTPSRGSTWTR